MNDLIEFLQSHASVRTFTDDDITPEQERTIVETAERSPTSSNLHAYSIVSIRDKGHKETFAKLAGNQQHVAACPLFLVFCADLHRLQLLAEQRQYAFYGDYTEAFLVASVDASLAACRALTAAQALGFGGVMVGGIRNNPQEASRLLQLPKLVYPVMGMSLGKPIKAPKKKPRLPLEGLWFKEKYDSTHIMEAVKQYDDIIDEVGYLKGREVEKDHYPDFDDRYSWSEHSARRMASDSPTARRDHLLEFLQNRGFLKK